MTVGAAKKGGFGNGPSTGGKGRQSCASQAPNPQQESIIKQKCIEVRPLNEKMHYL